MASGNERWRDHIYTPEECPVIRPIREQKAKVFVKDENLQSCDDLYQEVTKDGLD